MSLIITQNDILFSNITNTGLQTGNRRSNVKYTKKDGSALPTRPGTEDIEIAQSTPFINVIDVDWNGAELKNGSTVKATLNTTGDMLSILQTAYNYATTYTGKTSLTSSSVLGTINGQSLKYGGSIDIEVGSDVTETTVSGWGFTKNTGTVKSVNNNAPDQNGNVNITVGTNVTESTVSGWGFTKNTGTVKSVNNSTPDQNGNVNITVGTNVTESTVSNWGFTKNTGTVTGIKMNGGSKGTSGVVDLGTVLVNISNDYQTNTNNNTALSTSGAHTLYTDLNNKIDNLQSGMQNNIDNLLYQLSKLTNRVAALENHHTTVSVSSIKLNKTELTLTGKNATEQLTATIEPSNATNKTIKWTSSHPDIATVSNIGVITPKSPSVSSAVTITATATDGSNISASCSVTVNDGTVTLNGIEPQNPTIEEGQTQEFRLSYINTSFDDVKFTWTVKQGDVEYNNLISSSSSNIVLFTAPTFVSTSAELLYTYTLTVTNGVSASAANTSTTITVTKKEEPVETKYYWYAGQTEPISMTTNPTPSSTFTCNNWFEIGTTLPTSIVQQVTGGTKGNAWYAAMPTDAGLVAGTSADPDTSIVKEKTITINGVKYDVWYAGGVTASRFNLNFNK